MKFGFRRTSIKGRISARTSWKRFVRHNMGLKAPRGYGWITNPKKAAYNRIYHRVTIDPVKLLVNLFKPKKIKTNATKKILSAQAYQQYELNDNLEYIKKDRNMKRKCSRAFTMFIWAIIVFILISIGAGFVIRSNNISKSKIEERKAKIRDIEQKIREEQNAAAEEFKEIPYIPMPTKTPEQQIRDMRAAQGEAFVDDPTKSYSNIKLQQDSTFEFATSSNNNTAINNQTSSYQSQTPSTSSCIPVQVGGYYRKNGTYVAPYTRCKR